MPLTYQGGNDMLSETGRREDEIEITEEMIEAGMAEYDGRWCGLHDADDDIAKEMLREAFFAMYRLLPK